jgi:hypothetical protein
MSKAIAFFSDTAPVGKTPPTLELFQLFSASPQVGHLVFESAAAAQKTGTFKTPLFRGGCAISMQCYQKTLKYCQH